MILYVGRLAPEKDIDIVIQTYQALPDILKKDTHLLVVGDGPLYNTYVKKLLPQVTFTGFIEGPELANIYASSENTELEVSLLGHGGSNYCPIA
ncbi:glycosyltransferase [Desulfuribacillus alkaliarsenatis]|uniref:glycosyltransferase n=1 Tax=Desulfuribacillus alkaliarsenatis TaxID=766136 RepID=UPI0009FE809F